MIRVSVGTVSLNQSSACESLAELERILGLLRKFCTGEYQKPKKKRFCGCVQGLLNFQQLNVLGFKVKVGTLSLNESCTEVIVHCESFRVLERIFESS